MNDMFKSDGELGGTIEDYFGKDGRIVREIFNPDIEGTPLNRLKTIIIDWQSNIQNSQSEAKGRKEESKSGTQKGIKFEEFCEPFLNEAARVYSDTVEPTGTITTKGGDSKKGDFVVTLDGIGKKIVFEMKHRETMTVPKIKNELSEAMENRNADYAVLVSRSKSMMSRDVGWFNEYDKNKLLCALAETDDDDDVNTWIIEMAYRWARSRVVSASDSHLDIDTETVKQNVLDIESSVSRMNGIKRQCKNITQSAGIIEKTMTDEEQVIKSKINDILKSMDSV